MTRRSKRRHRLPSPPPRIAELLPAARRVRLLLVVALLVLPPLVMLIGSRMLQELRDLTTLGQQTKGTILAREAFSNVRGGIRNRVRYAFEVSGLTFQGQADNVASREFQSFDAGTPCDVTYLPGQPEIHCLGLPAPRLAERTTITFFLACAVFAVILGIILVKETEYRRELDLARHGEACPSNIVDLWTEIRHRSKPLQWVTYRFQWNNVTYQGRNTVPHPVWLTLSRGATVTVLFDPTNPKRHILPEGFQSCRFLTENRV